VYFKPLLDEFVKLCGCKLVIDECQVKVAAVTAEEARNSLGRLDQLESVRKGELGRGALVGAAVGPVMSNVGRLISGGKRPGSMLRQTAAEMTTGAIFGGALPYARNRLERTVEREKLKDYLEGGRSKTLRSKVRRSVGV